MDCADCHKTTQAKRLPPGWHRDHAGQAVCAKCWNARYILRAVTIPVVGPVDGTWEELRKALKTCFSGATRLSNWAVTELAKADVVRTPDMDALPKPNIPYLYPGAREIAPEVDSGSVVAILHAVQGRWMRRRYNVVWLGKESLPNYRYPTPYPVRSQDWRAIQGNDGEALVGVRLAGRRWTLRLRGGQQFRRQLQSHRLLCQGAAVAAELSLYEQRANGGDHRNGTQGRDSGGQRKYSRLMCKMVLWLPRSPQRDLSGTLYARTDTDSLLIALNAKEERVWIHHADHLRRWTAEHTRRLNRWSDDQKAEQRPTASYQSRREATVRKYRRRLDSVCHEAAAQLVSYARRRRFAVLRYDDSEQAYCCRFPWEKLRRLIAEKADAAGIEFEWSNAPKKAATSRKDAKED